MFSAAFNNVYRLCGTPDPQTGQFSFTHSFGKVRANAGLGPHCELAMTFSSLSTLSGNTTGLGTGFSFKLTRYNGAGQLLTLSSGQTYKVLNPLQDKPWVLSHKVKDIKVQAFKEGEEIHIYHKTGEVEILQTYQPQGNGYISQLMAPDGRYLKFSYTEIAGYNRLQKIVDSESTLATVEYYDNDGKVKVILHPKTSYEVTSTLHYQSNGVVTAIEDTSGKGNAQLEYMVYSCASSGSSENQYLHFINKVTYSTGATEKIEYNEQLFLPNEAPIQYLPAISKYTKTVGPEPEVTTFEYPKLSSGQPGPNFWGYLSGVPWDNNYDNLWDLEGEYIYSTVMTHNDRVVTSHYNKFHQVLSTVEASAINPKYKKITTNEYYSNGTTTLNDQSLLYELLKTKTVIHVSPVSSSSESASKSYTYDDWGNKLIEAEVTGVKTINEYYPATGGEGCPPHPFNMVNYLKQKTVQANDGSSTKTSSYTYQSIEGVNGIKAVVLPLAKTYAGWTRSYTFYDSKTPKIQCKKKREMVTAGDKTTTTTTDYKFGKDTLQVTKTLTSHDGLVASGSETISLWTGVTLEKVNKSGVVEKYFYDLAGRLTSKKEAAGSDYELDTTFTYVDNPKLISSNEAIIGTLVTKKSNKGTTLIYYNGSQHKLIEYRQDEAGTFRKVSEKKYDHQGRVATEYHYDYIFVPKTQAIQQVQSTSCNYVYGHWGEKCEIRHNNGVIELNHCDPTKLQHVHQLVRRDDPKDPGKVTSSLGSTITTYNLFGHKTNVKVLDSSGNVYSTTAYSYDGFGRKTAVTSPSKATSKVNAYDDFDRQIKFQQPDGTKYDVSYIDFSSEKLVSSLKVSSAGDFVVGQRTYDGLSRITSRTANGVHTEFSYKDSLPRPSRLLNGRKQTTLFDYIPELGNHLSRSASYTDDVSIGDWKNPSKVSESSFKYIDTNATGDDLNHIGRIISASSSTANYEYKYTKRGLLQKETQAVGSQSKCVNYKNASLFGKPVSIDFDGRSIELQYDGYGKLISTTDGQLKIETSYNLFDLPVKIVVKGYDSNTNSYNDTIQETDIEYDEFCHEVSRTISVKKTNQVTSIQSFYDTESKLIQRVTTINGKAPLTESLSYDIKNRLVSYTAESSDTDLLPQNEYGHKFESQSFVYNQLDCITSIITTFPNNGSSDTATLVYDKTNKQRLQHISHTLTSGPNAYPPVITLTYDADGNIVSINDRTMTYTVSGRMATNNKTAYSYDPYDRLVKTDETVRYYLGSDVIQEVNGSDVIDLVKHGQVPVAQVVNGVNKVYGTDQKFSVISVTDDTSTTSTTYGPYGTAGDNGSRIGLNGELKDLQDCNMYPLGNGTRCFLPGIAGFAAPDTFTPFMGGGFNPYSYCECDPLNAMDPSGHSIGSIIADCFGIAISFVAVVAVPFTGGSSLAIGFAVASGIFGLVSAGLQLGADIEALKGHEGMSSRLDKAAFAFGILSAVCGVVSAVADVKGALEVRNIASEINPNDPTATSTFSVNDVVSAGFKCRFKLTSFAKSAATIGKLDLDNKTLSTVAKESDVFEVRGFYLRKIIEPYDEDAIVRGNGIIRTKGNTITKNLKAKLVIQRLASTTAYAVTKAISEITNDEENEENDSKDNQANKAKQSSNGIPTYCEYDFI